MTATVSLHPATRSARHITGLLKRNQMRLAKQPGSRFASLVPASKTDVDAQVTDMIRFASHPQPEAG